MLRIALFIAVIMMLLTTGTPGFCQSIPVPYPGPQTGVRPCTPNQPVRSIQPVARSVNVTVPVPQPPKSYISPGCAAPPYCPPGASAAAPSRPMPVRVDIAVRPEAFDQRYPVPVVYRDPGFFGPIVQHSVGLVGAVVAAPFRVAEMLCPLEASACPQRKQCGPPPCAMNQGCSRPAAPPQWVGKCPMPITQPMPPCPPVMTCAPTGPSVAPLPPGLCAPPCRPNFPPKLLEEYQFPQFEAQDLLSGIWNLPGTLIRTGRVAGDMHGTSPCAPLVGW